MAESTMKARLHLGTTASVNLPYTATADGVMYINYAPTAVVQENLRFLIENSYYISLNSPARGTLEGISFVMKKGQTVSYGGGGTGNLTAYFCPFT